jgi:hypothetical protein
VAGFEVDVPAGVFEAAHGVVERGGPGPVEWYVLSGSPLPPEVI